MFMLPEMGENVAFAKMLGDLTIRDIERFKSSWWPYFSFFVSDGEIYIYEELD